MLAIILAELLGLAYATTAGVITMLSIFDTRKQTYITGIKRILFAGIAIILASVIFWFGSHTLLMLGVFLLSFTLMLTWLNSLDAWAISTVLVSHIYTFQELSFRIILNELGLVVIGVGLAWILNLHMPNRIKAIKEDQAGVEEEMKRVLKIMRLRLVNQCSIEDKNRGLKRLDQLLEKGQKEAIQYSNNYIFIDNSYYIYYFQMRRQQFLLLMHMDKYLERMFITGEQAQPLSDFTGRIADEFAESNTGVGLKEKGEGLLEYYRSTPLPSSREEFENRAVLFRYLSDLIEFVEIKIQFSQKFR
jgi:uncharacterized membrane protein YgaE (UPF0421/DUF939 family)